MGGLEKGRCRSCGGTKAGRFINGGGGGGGGNMETVSLSCWLK